ncbi:MAG: class I SAM-dependent methyltransferase [Pseudomonadota bacterium]
MAPTTADQSRPAYEQRAAAFDRFRPRGLAERPYLDLVLGACDASPGRLLDLGCGAGEPIAAYFIDQGWQVTGVDFAAPMIEICKERFPDHDWRLDDMRGLDLGRTFNGIIAWDSFFHLGRDEQRAMFPVFASHLEPDGVVVFSSGDKDGDNVVGAIMDIPVYHASLDSSEYAAQLSKAGFDVIRQVIEEPSTGRTVWAARRL